MRFSFNLLLFHMRFDIISNIYLFLMFIQLLFYFFQQEKEEEEEE